MLPRKKLELPKPSPLWKVIKDTYGSLWRIAAAPPAVGPKGFKFDGTARVDVWWDRDIRKKHDENLIIRQDAEDKADVITLTLGQVYALIGALNKAVEER